MKERIATVKTTSEILFKNKINPKPRYGQNFLVVPKIPQLVSNLSFINKDSFVLEIGPGLGALTQFLVEKAKRVLSIEIDSTLYEINKELFKEYDNYEIINQDILDFDFSNLDLSIYSNFVVVSNLPYYITSDILIRLMKLNINFDLVAMMQKEVAHRILNKSDINELVLYTNLFSEISLVSEVSKNDFFPKPKVDSTILHFKKNTIDFDINTLERIINCLYSQRRKTIYKNLRILNSIELDDFIIESIISKASITNLTRIDELSFDKQIDLIEIIYKHVFIKTPAKINLGLKVYPKQNNYHNLSSIFVPINLYDTFEIYFTKQGKEIINDTNNPISKVIELVSNKLNKEFNYKIYVNKNIPIEAGLGGSSSDCAAFINYFKYIFNLSDNDCCEIAKQIGADTVYFLDPKPKILINSLYDFKEIEIGYNPKILLIKSKQGCSTKEIFQLFDSTNQESFDMDFYRAATDYNYLCSNCKNDLTDSAIKKCSEISKVFSHLENYKFDLVNLSGSGSCIYCLINNKTNLRKLCEELNKTNVFYKIVEIVKNK